MCSIISHVDSESCETREWRNWQTRTFEGRVVHTVRVQVPFLAKTNRLERVGFVFVRSGMEAVPRAVGQTKKSEEQDTARPASFSKQCLPKSRFTNKQKEYERFVRAPFVCRYCRAAISLPFTGEPFYIQSDLPILLTSTACCTLFVTLP